MFSSQMLVTTLLPHFLGSTSSARKLRHFTSSKNLLGILEKSDDIIGAFVPGVVAAIFLTAILASATAFAQTATATSQAVIVGANYKIILGDLNADGELDLVTVTMDGVNVGLGNGDGTFRSRVSYATGSIPSSIAIADFNKDGNLDLAVTNAGSNTVSILPGNGNGTFADKMDYTGGGRSFVVGDFNSDGNLDLATTTVGVSVLLGNGDNTFQAPYLVPMEAPPSSIVTGDFNHDGKLDLALPNGLSGGLYPPNFAVDIFLGRGDGSFQPATHYFTDQLLEKPQFATVADLNSDGNLDIAVASFGENPKVDDVRMYGYITRLLGNADGTFQTPVSKYGDRRLFYPQAADFHANGTLDLAVASGYSCGSCTSTTAPSYIRVFSGDAGFLYSATEFRPAAEPSFSIGDVNEDGKLDMVALAEDSIVVLIGNGDGTFYKLRSITTTPNPLSFPPTALGTSSTPRDVTVENTGNDLVTLSSMQVTGDFTRTGGTCGTSLKIGYSCTISIAFHPTAVGARTGSLIINDNALHAPHTVTLTGTGVGAITLSPTSLSFPTRLVGTTSAAQVVTVANMGPGPVTISSISTTGDFNKAATTCVSSLAAGATCTVNVTFRPTAIGARSGALNLIASGSTSPQSVALSGEGTVITASPTSLTFGAHLVGSVSAAILTVTNHGSTAVTISSISLTGDYSHNPASDTCTSMLAALASCKIKVFFTPTTVGSRSGKLNIYHNGGGSPRTVSLKGSGT